MNILVVTDKLTIDGRSPTCIALNLRDSNRRFMDRNCDLTICNLRDKDPGAELLSEAGMRVIKTGFPSYSPRTLPALIRAARQIKADVIHAHGYASANHGRVAGRLLKLPVVVHEHAILKIRPHQYVIDFLLRGWTARGIAISDAVARFMIRGRSMPADRIAVIPNGIDLSRFRAAAGQDQAVVRSIFNWRKDALIIGSAARFRSEKGLEILFEAAAQLLRRFPDLICVMAGDGAGRTELQRQAESKGLSKNILFPGFVENIPMFMRALNILAIPSLQEGLGFSAMEAMATGTPVIASRAGGLPELIEDGFTGLLVPPGNANALAGAVEQLLTDEKKRLILAENAMRFIQAYDLDNYTDRMAEIYGQLKP